MFSLILYVRVGNCPHMLPCLYFQSWFELKSEIDFALRNLYYVKSGFGSKIIIWTNPVTDQILSSSGHGRTQCSTLHLFVSGFVPFYPFHHVASGPGCWRASRPRIGPGSLTLFFVFRRNRLRSSTSARLLLPRRPPLPPRICRVKHGQPVPAQLGGPSRISGLYDPKHIWKIWF